jgi:hypothetical protein
MGHLAGTSLWLFLIAGLTGFIHTDLTLFKVLSAFYCVLVCIISIMEIGLRSLWGFQWLLFFCMIAGWIFSIFGFELMLGRTDYLPHISFSLFFAFCSIIFEQLKRENQKKLENQTPENH